MLNKKGFTLAELLIVVAIIAVLVAIAIPIFTNQLEKSRESTDLANARSAYAAVMTSAAADDTTSSLYQGDGTYQMTISPLKQTKYGWTTKIDEIEIGGIPSTAWEGEPKAEGSCTVSFNTSTSTVTINWGGSGGGASGGDDSGEGGSSSDTPVSLDSGTKTAIENALLDLIGTPQGSQKLTVTIRNGTVSVDDHGNPSGRVSETSVINTLKNIPGVTFDDSGRMLSNGHPVSDTIEVHYKPNGH